MGLTLRRDMTLEPRPDIGPDTYALSGTPTDCMMVALDATRGLLVALGLAPLLALSGPNYGPNMGTDVLLSGTVGAARTAGLYGVPAIAASSTCLDKMSSLENAVAATERLAALALGAVGWQPAPNWPRNHMGVGGGAGRRHTGGSCEYEQLPPGWVLDGEQVLLDAFRAGDVFLNLNVPQGWQPGGPLDTTGLGLMYYRDSYLVSVPGAEGQAEGAANGSGPSNGNGNGNGHANGHAHGHANGNGHAAAEAARPPSADAADIAKALSAGRPVVFNNAYDTRRLAAVERSDVVALQRGHATVSTLQTWPEGHTLCLSDRVMAAALRAGPGGVPAWVAAGSAVAAAAN